MNNRAQLRASALLLSALAGFVVGCAPLRNEVRVTYIANEGFLIQSGPDKVIIDALFHDDALDYCDVPSAELLQQIESGRPPFANIDLLLVTHAHVDHFDAASVARFLEHNRRCRLVCPGPVRDALQATAPDYAVIQDRIHVPLSDADAINTTTFNGLRVTALRLRHGAYFIKDEQTGQEYDRHADVVNFGYVVELSGNLVLHVGDALLHKNHEVLTQLGKPIDIAFVEGYDISPESLQIMSTVVAPQHVVYMHLPTQNRQRLIDGILARNPTATVFTQPLAEKCFR